MSQGFIQSGVTGFDKPSYASELKTIKKGGVTKITVKPRVLIENMTDDTNIVDTLESGTTDLGQIFRLTTDIDNIDRVHLTLEATAGGAVSSIDDFESYADTTALRAVWVPNDTTNSPNTLDTTVFQEGAKAMKCDMLSKQKSKNDTFIKTYGSNQDWSAKDGVQLQFRNDTNATIELHIEDASGNGSKATLTVSNTGVFEFIEINFSEMIPVGASPADLATIKKIKLFVRTASVGPFYVDKLETFTIAAYGTANLELYDFGTTATPASLSSGTLVQTETFSLSAGELIYEVPFSVSGLTSDNYYGIVLTAPTTSDIKWKGKNGSNLYTNGFSFNSTDNDTITATGAGDDFYFSIFAIDEAIFHGIRFVSNADAGLGKVNVFINDNASGKGKTSLFLGERFIKRTTIDFPIRNQTSVEVPVNKDELIYILYEDDQTSAITRLQATVFYTFVNRNIHG